MRKRETVSQKKLAYPDTKVTCLSKHRRVKSLEKDSRIVVNEAPVF